MAPDLAQIKVDTTNGVPLAIAENLIIYVDDEGSIGNVLGMYIEVLNSKGNNSLANLSYQFVLSKELGLEQTIRTIQGLIYQAPENCQIGIILDHDQKTFFGSDLAREVKIRCDTPEQMKKIKFVAYTANGQIEKVREQWNDIGPCFPKIASGDANTMNTSVVGMLNYLFKNEN